MLGRIWEFKFGNPGKKLWGFCEYDKPNKRIIIDKTLTGKKKLEIIIHELLHAADLHKDESWIEETARDLSHILWRLNYRNLNESNDEKSKV